MGASNYLLHQCEKSFAETDEQRLFSFSCCNLFHLDCRYIHRNCIHFEQIAELRGLKLAIPWPALTCLFNSRMARYKRIQLASYSRNETLCFTVIFSIKLSPFSVKERTNPGKHLNF